MNRILILFFATFLLFLKTWADDFESATEAVKNMRLGWNMGNTLDANNQQQHDATQDNYWGQQDITSETCWGQFTTKPKLFAMMKTAGFGAIRVPVTWYNHMDKDGNVDEAWMNRVREVVDYIISQGLYCIINVHHDTGADRNGFKSWIKADPTNYASNETRYKKLWQQIAQKFRDYDHHLLFEAYNEMLDTQNSWNYASFNSPGQYNATVASQAYSAINSYAQSFVDVVRATGGNNAQRNIIVNTYAGCAGYGAHGGTSTYFSHLLDPLKEINKPTGESNHIIFQVHTYPDISNLNSTKTQIDQMISDLNTHLVSKGAPVIIGEWGTSNVDAGEGKTDYDIRRDQMFQFVDYFIKKTKENNIATFYWMGLSDGMSRLYPAFYQSDLALKMLKAYHGDAYSPTLPDVSDYNDAAFTATIHYWSDKQWAEFNLFKGSISSSEYQGIQLELETAPTNNELQFKVIGKSTTTTFINQSSSSLVFTSAMGTITNITLQWCKETSGTVKIKGLWLIQKDGTKQACNPSVAWGCDMSDVDIITGIHDITATPARPAHEVIYNLHGQRITTPQKGIYIKNGKKLFLK